MRIWWGILGGLLAVSANSWAVPPKAKLVFDFVIADVQGRLGTAIHLLRDPEIHPTYAEIFTLLDGIEGGLWFAESIEDSMTDLDCPTLLLRRLSHPVEYGERKLLTHTALIEYARVDVETARVNLQARKNPRFRPPAPTVLDLAEPIAPAEVPGIGRPLALLGRAQGLIESLRPAEPPPTRLPEDAKNLLHSLTEKWQARDALAPGEALGPHDVE